MKLTRLRKMDGYEMNPLSKEHYQLARNRLAEKGRELTLEELAEECKTLFETIRCKMAEKGHDLSDLTDEDIFLLMNGFR